MEGSVFDIKSSYDSDEFVAPTSESGEGCCELSTRFVTLYNFFV